MSSKAGKKNAVAKTNEILTRTKAAQQSRQLRAKNKKTVKPIAIETKPSTKPEKSIKIEKSDNCCKDTPLRNKVRQLVELVEQVEYHPDKLKRDLSIKKILLKPKSNFKVIASANKRKLGVPQKGGIPQTPLKKRRRSSPKTSKRDSFCEMSMPDIVRLIEDTQSLSDEDFMEILTCPSPVWWEDPPDDDYIEDAICKRTPPQCSPISISTDENNGPEGKDDKQTNISTDTQTSSHELIDFENEIEEFKITGKLATTTSNNKFKAKKQKLEHILGNIKNVKNNKNKNVKSNKGKNKDIKKNVEIYAKPRRLSTSTDGEDLSDLSFNEEEVLKNLENIQIPIEQTEEQNEDEIKKVNIIDKATIEKEVRSPRKKVMPKPIKKELSIPRITVKSFARKSMTNELIVPDKMPPLTRKPDIKTENYEHSNSADYLDNVSHSSFKFISDDDVSLIEDKDKSSLGESSSYIATTDEIKEENEIKKEQINTANTTGTNNKVFFRKKVIKDLSEYITVYKIMSHENEKNAIDSEKLNKNTENTNNVSGKLNNFFKKRKSNKRVVKSDSSFPANSLTAAKDLPIDKVSNETSVVNDENRLKPCDCVVKTENGLPCDSCNFHTTKEVCKNHVSSCKDIARIPWNHNYLTNQT